ncbi:MAG: tetratricopeptide repeat protein [Deltaproteobacteria bacterium]|nr:tetratricopeptide repeat protein [Deltaproteobacteria bacterium]MBW1986349.1 tetratricopeptide repeat protein [Deltaproteobacteria bacterium]MBW2134391.1 tetratricopeptide repeat protein [Deltaproteobacteria bacterium]
MARNRLGNTKFIGRIKDYLKSAVILLIVGFLTSGCGNRPIYNSWLKQFSTHVRPYYGDINRLQQNARYFKMIGKPELAIKDLEEAHRQCPEDLKVINILARTYDELGEFDRAQELYQQGLAQQSKNPAMINNLGFSYYLAGKFQQAEDCFRKVLVHEPNNLLARNNLGLLLCRQERLEEARQLWTEIDGQAQAQKKMKEVLAMLGMRAPEIYAQKSPSRPISAPSSMEPGNFPISEAKKVAAKEPSHEVRSEPEKQPMAAKEKPVVSVEPSPSRVVTSKNIQSAAIEQKPYQSADITAKLEEPSISPKATPVATESVRPDEITVSKPERSETTDQQAPKLPILTAQELLETAIDIRNGNGVKNMARDTRSRLSLEGFNVVSIANHIDFGARKTLIYYRPGKDRVVKVLSRKFFPVAKAEESLNLPSWSDVKIILGHDLVPQNTFLAKLAKWVE